MNKVFQAGIGIMAAGLLLGGSSGGVAEAVSTPFVTGGGSGIFPFPPFAGDRVGATVSARQVPDGSVQAGP